MVALSATTMPVAVENRPSLDALFSYRVCAVSFNKVLQLSIADGRAARSLWRLQLNTGTLGRSSRLAR